MPLHRVKIEQRLEKLGSQRQFKGGKTRTKTYDIYLNIYNKKKSIISNNNLILYSYFIC